MKKYQDNDLVGLGELEAMEAIATPRNEGRFVIPDAFDVPVLNYKPLQKPDEETLRRIRIVLCLQAYNHHSFPRCRYRDFKRASMLDQQLGYTQEEALDKTKGYHTKDAHVCAECRCQHMAGAGTRGWWYWAPEDGPEHGHYGVGPCFKHSPWYNYRFIEKQRANYRDMIMREVRTMQEFGKMQDRQGMYMVDVKNMGELARARTDTKSSLYALKQLADETIARLKEHKGSPDAEAAMIEGLCDVFGFPPDMLDPKDRSRIVMLASSRPLTETSAGKHIPMSDKTAIQLQKELLKAVGDSAFQSFKSHEEDFMKKETVAAMIERFYAEAETLFRPLGGEETWGRFREALRDVARELTDGGNLGDHRHPRKDIVVNTTQNDIPVPDSLPPHQRTPEEDAQYFEDLGGEQ